ncbi:MAG: hypothetical protein IKB38_09975 [Clostridia bacterium]|nr:hypothetical protein [Clostridia bacterium]
MENRHSEYKKRIRKARRTFITQTVIFSLLLALGVTALVLWNDELRIFISAAGLTLLSALRLIFIIKSRTVRIFSKEITGTVVEIKETPRILDKKLVGSFGSFSDIRPYEQDRCEVVVGTLFIERKDGSIFTVDELNEDQTAFFAKGDEVVIFAGAKFPLVTNEPPSREKWLCPVCGSVSPDGVDCPVCGLEFS